MRGTGVTQILLKGAGNTGHGTVLEFVEALPFIPDTLLKVLKAIDQEEFQPGQVLGGFVDSHHNLFYLIALRFDGLSSCGFCAQAPPRMPGSTQKMITRATSASGQGKSFNDSLMVPSGH